MNNVLVLMSTYNGEKYLREQIESILNQDGVQVSLYIRDDGSTDDTASILHTIQNQYSNIVVDFGKNIGWRASYSRLLVEAAHADFYSFSDQDDLWMPNKLAIALAMMKGEKEKPCLYRGRSEIADGNLVRSGVIYQDTPIPNRKRALFQNFSQGCTLVFNDKLRELYLRHPIPTASHDVWLSLIALETGTVIDDTNAYMLYRVHEDNASMTKSSLNIWKRRLDGFLAKSKSNYTFNYGEILYNEYNDVLYSDARAVCKQMATYRQSATSKVALLLNREVRGNRILRTLMVKWFIISNQYRCDC